MELFEKFLVTSSIILPLALLIWQLNLNKIALMEYRLSSSIPKALHKIERWYTLRYIVKLFAMLFFSLSLSKFFTGLIESVFIFELTFIFSAIVYLFFLDVIDAAITQNTYNTLRKIKLSLAEKVVDIAKGYFIFLFSILLIRIVILSIRIENSISAFNQFTISALRTLAIVLIVKIGEIIIPFILILFSKAIRTRDVEIEMFAEKQLSPCVYKRLKIYISADTDAQAVVTDAFFKKILITRRLIDASSMDELKAIMLHEFGHIKLRHLSKQSSRNLLVFVVISLASGFLASGIIDLVANFTFAIIFDMIELILGIFLLGFLFYDIIIVRAALSRKHEKEADEYVINSGVDPQIYISALQKLYSLNDDTPSLSKFEELISTHPSLENRIKYINEFAESMGK